MFSKTVDTKPLIKLDNGVTIRDLTVSVFSRKDRNSISDYDVFKTPASAACRPDIVAMLYYRDEEHTETVLKFNGISNPFRMMPGDIIKLPSIMDAERLMIGDQASSYGDKNGKYDYYQKGLYTSHNNNGPEAIKQKIRDSYKYINPKNIKEILATSDKNKEFDTLIIPKGRTAPYINEGNGNPIYEDTSNGRFVIPGDNNTSGNNGSGNRAGFDTNGLDNHDKTISDLIKEHAKKAADNGCIDIDGETAATVNFGVER